MVEHIDKQSADKIFRILDKRFGKDRWSAGVYIPYWHKNDDGNIVIKVDIGGKKVESMPEADFYQEYFSIHETRKLEISPDGNIVKDMAELKVEDYPKPASKVKCRIDTIFGLECEVDDKYFYDDAHRLDFDGEVDIDPDFIGKLNVDIEAYLKEGYCEVMPGNTLRCYKS